MVVAVAVWERTGLGTLYSCSVRAENLYFARSRNALNMSDADSPEPIAESLDVTLDVNDLELEKAFSTAALGREVKTELHGWAAFDLSHGEMLDL